MAIDTKDPQELLIEATVRREVQKQLAQLPQQSSGTKRLTADEYDFVAHPCNLHPGADWFLIEAFSLSNGNIYILWAISRVDQTRNKQVPVMSLPGSKA